MLCDRCNKNPATVHVTKIINGNKYEINLCESCAKEKEGLGLGGEMDFASSFSFHNILSGIMDYMSQSAQSQKSYELICENCGTTYSEFKQKGILGCSECYNNFNSTLIPVIKRVQANTEHTGKVPKKAGKELSEKRKLLKLKEELHKAIAAEEYERAAEIRDMIKELPKDN